MSTTTTEQTDQQKQDRRRLPKMLRNVDATAQAPEPAKKANAKKPALKPTTTTEAKAAPTKQAAKPAKPERPDYLRTVKGEVQQKCAGACGKWLPLDAYAKKSAARGGGPIRRCRACITAERKARNASKAETETKPTEEKS